MAESRPLAVEVSGGIGHELVTLRKRFPSLLGTMIAEDYRVVIRDANDLPSSVAVIAHDFFAA